MRSASLLCGLLLLTACPKSAEGPGAEAPIPDPGGDVFPERMFAVAGPTEGVIGGLDGAAPFGTRITILDDSGAELAHSDADARGRFRFSLPLVADQTVRIAAGTRVSVAFRVRDPARARKDAVWPELGPAGTGPNDLVILGPPASASGVLVQSGANGVSPVDLDTGLEGSRPGVRLPTVDVAGRTRPAIPWFVAPLSEDGARVATTANGQRRIYVVDLAASAIERTLELAPVTLPEAFVLPRPFDVDNDGDEETAVTEVSPSTPQAVCVAGGRLIAGFNNVLAARTLHEGPIQLPPVLASWRLDDLDAPPQILVLPVHNPQELRVLDDGRVLVIASGILDLDGDRWVPITSAGAFVLDPESHAIVESFDLGLFAAGTGVLADDALWVGSITAPELRRIARRGNEAPRTLRLNDELVDSVFRMVELGGGLVGVPSFDTDRLHVLDLVTGELDPSPFYGPLEVGPGRPVFDGLQIVARRPGRRGVDFTAPDLYALFGPGAVLVPIELRKILGP